MTAAAAHQIPKLLFAGPDIKLAMKVVVGGREFRQIAGLGKLLLERNGQVQLTHELIAVVECQRSHDFQFERLPQNAQCLPAVERNGTNSQPATA